MKMQEGYEWLLNEAAPRILVEVLNLYGTKEVPGKGNSREIIGWAVETNTTYPGDNVAWCGLTMSVAAKRAGYDYHPNGNALWAKNWLDWGNPVPDPMLGDMCIFSRPGGGGHVGLYVGEDVTHYHILGGNQQDGVRISRIDKKRLLGARRTPWRIGQPPNVRRIYLTTTGAPTSANEE